jgi:hypothetical protein
MDTAPKTDGLTTVEEPMYEWSALPWTHVERQVFCCKRESIEPPSVATYGQSTDYRDC